MTDTLQRYCIVFFTVTPIPSQREVEMTEDIKVDDLPEDAVSVDVPVEEMEDDRLDRKTVSKIVERERQKAYEKARREAMNELQSQQASPEMQQAPQLGGMQISQDDLNAMIAKALPHHLQEHIQGIQTQHMVDSFTSKMQAAESRHPGLNEKLNKIEDYRGIAPLIQMANGLDNAGDVMADLLENPGKMGSILALAQAGQNQYAMHVMHELSNSIKVNQDAAANEKQALDPLKQLKSSSMTTGSDDGEHNMSVRDIQKLLSQRR